MHRSSRKPRPLIIGIAAVLIGIIFDTDSYFYGLLPVLIGIGQAFGTEPVSIAVAKLLGRMTGCYISLMEHATLLGTELAEVDIKDRAMNRSRLTFSGLSCAGSAPSFAGFTI